MATRGSHVHPEYATEGDLHREIGRVTDEVKGLRGDVQNLSSKFTMVMGAIGILAFLIPIAAPFIRSLLNIGP